MYFAGFDEAVWNGHCPHLEYVQFYDKILLAAGALYYISLLIISFRMKTFETIDRGKRHPGLAREVLTVNRCSRIVPEPRGCYYNGRMQIAFRAVRLQKHSSVAQKAGIRERL
jgi:hypothetical protein